MAWADFGQALLRWRKDRIMGRSAFVLAARRVLLRAGRRCLRDQTRRRYFPCHSFAQMESTMKWRAR
jgi:hypothetical protein